MRISDCEGAIARMTPGVSYSCQGDIIPSAAADALRLKISAFFNGAIIPIIDAVVPNSSVEAGLQYTLAWTIVPSTFLSGSTVPVTAEVVNEESQELEVCTGIMTEIAGV